MVACGMCLVAYERITAAQVCRERRGALQCDGTEAEGVFVELKAGSCVLHHGATLHYSRGNSTALNRRAFIVNFRP